MVLVQLKNIVIAVVVGNRDPALLLKRRQPGLLFVTI